MARVLDVLYRLLGEAQMLICICKCTALVTKQQSRTYMSLHKYFDALKEQNFQVCPSNLVHGQAGSFAVTVLCPPQNRIVLIACTPPELEGAPPVAGNVSSYLGRAVWPCFDVQMFIIATFDVTSMP